jgi:hypothetical protein
MVRIAASAASALHLLVSVTVMLDGARSRCALVDPSKVLGGSDRKRFGRRD